MRALNEVYIADTLRLLGRPEEALAAYLPGYRDAQACGNYSAMTSAAYHRAEILAQLGRFKEAAKHLEEALPISLRAADGTQAAGRSVAST